ncbi:hypothetical protein SAMD00019534_077860 [Acytostelium subglobosum LB1]|uniref:hypothetical protein n=1 Tax=Acytostelium subglobosum LB1 TaxID=1410327 RepID=UPI000644FAAA|nr:hypothetical protein SAMD00019534_077860 [Acytostelium subglobosum LB1]GAM24611.1 hypothetical protein SAMD00019534_077860 [Acytostelium subglobosum LB1]|eukprot:XP_012752280.1 hypothetical protein SAMD00019534_077860 [Acytostelium subglobosum LB1]
MANDDDDSDGELSNSKITHHQFHNVLRSVVIRSVLFSSVGEVHSRMGLRSRRGCDILSLVEAVQFGHTELFIHHFDRMYIGNGPTRDRLHCSLHNIISSSYNVPCNLLYTIRESFIQALHKNNHKLVEYIIDQVKDVFELKCCCTETPSRLEDGSMTTNKTGDQRSSLTTVASILLLRLSQDDEIHPDRKMYDVLMRYPPDWFDVSLVTCLGDMSLFKHHNVRLFKSLANRSPLHRTYMTHLVDPERRIYKARMGGLFDKSNIELFRHQVSSDDIMELVKWHEETSAHRNNGIVFKLFILALEYKRFDVALLMATKGTLLKVVEYDEALAKYANIELLSAINYTLPDIYVKDILNQTKINGNIDFLKHCHSQIESKVMGLKDHLSPAVLDIEMINHIRSHTHDYALYVLYNLSHLLQIQSDKLGTLGNKWTVTNIDVHSDWMVTKHLTDTLIADKNRVKCRFSNLYSNLYRSALTQQRVEVIEYVHQLISNDQTKVDIITRNFLGREVSTSATLECIASLVGTHPSLLHLFTIKYDDLIQSNPDSQQILLSLIISGQLVFDGHYENMTTDTLQLIHRHGHGIPKVMFLAAAKLGALEIMNNVFHMGMINDNQIFREVVNEVCNASGDVDTLRYLKDHGFSFDIKEALSMALYKGNFHTVDYLLTMPEHVERGGTPGSLMRDQFIHIMGYPDKIDPASFIFMLHRLETAGRMDKAFIIQVLKLARCHWHIYRSMLDMLERDQCRYQRFIPAPLFHKSKIYQFLCKDNYRSTNSVVQLFRPQNSVDDYDNKVCPFIIPYSEKMYQKYQKMIINSGRFPLLN